MMRASRPRGNELARPVVRARAGFHGDDAAGGQWGAPRKESVACQRTAGEHAATGINDVNLDHALGQIDPRAYGFPSCVGSCNLFHGLPLSTLQVDYLHHQSGLFVAVARRWEVPSYSARGEAQHQNARPAQWARAFSTARAWRFAVGPTSARTFPRKCVRSSSLRNCGDRT